MTNNQASSKAAILRAHLKQRGFAVVQVTESDYSDLGPLVTYTALSPGIESEALSDIAELMEDSEFDSEATAEIPRATMDHLRALSSGPRTIERAVLNDDRSWRADQTGRS